MRKIIGILFFDVIRKRVDIRTRYSNYQTPFKAEFLSIIICFGVTTMVSSYDTFAASNIVAGTTEQIYNISAGSLKNALDQFTKQTGVSLSYDATELEGITTRGLNGKFSVKRGLDRLLAESGLQAVPQVEGYIVRKDQAPKPETKSTKKPTVLPMMQVSADKDSRYLAPRSTTAMKTNTLLRDTPQSITVVTQKQIQDQAPLSMAEAMRYVPGIGVSSGEGNRDAVVFRGQRSTGDFYIDGIRDDVQYFRDFYNIDRIEVLKGPNGMIFGRGGSGGVINRVRKEANWAPIHEIKFSAGTYDHKRFSLDVGHVINDMVAIRLNGLFEDSENFRDGFELQRYGVSPTITIKPTNRTKVVIHTELFDDERIADRGIPSFMGSPFNTKRSTFFGGPAARSPTDTTAMSIGMLIEHKFNNNVIIRNRTSYANFDKFYQNIFAGSSVNTAGMVTLGAYNDTTERENFFNQTDLLLTFDTWRFNHKVVTGVEVGRQVTDQVRLRGHFNGVSTTEVVSASFPNTATPVIFFNRGLQDSNNHVSNSLVSVFIQDQIEILPQLQAILGVRYNRFEVDFKRKDFLQPELNSRDDLIDPRFGLIFKPIEQVSIYGSYSLSHQPRAGDQLKSITVTNATLEPEKFTNIEAGIKWDILPNLAATTAFYQLDRDNVILPTGIAGVSFLGKGTRVRGVEAGINGQITDAWNIIGAYAYQEGTLDTTGATLGELPKHTYSIWNRYDFTPWFGAAFGVIGRSKMFTTTTNRVTLPAFARVDAALYGRINKYLRAQVNIENLFDVNYFVAAHNDNNIAPGAPITARATITATF